MSEAGPAVAGAARWRLPQAGINGLGLYVLVMYGVTYYAIGTAAPVVARDVGIATSTVFALLAIALIASALAAPAIGRLVDRAGAGRVLLAGAVLRALAVLGLAAAVDVWSLAAAILAIQLLSQTSEYDAAFAAAVQRSGERSRAAVTLITLWGGLASTAFWPLTAWLLDTVGWRITFVLFAGLMLLACAPVALWVMARERHSGSTAATEPQAVAAGDAAATPAAAGAEATSGRPDPARAFVPLTVAFSLAGVAMGLPVIMLPMLEGLGLGAGAVLAGMVFGPAQTAGRFFELVFAQGLRPLTIAVVATALLPASLLILVAGGASLATALVFAVLYGAGNGVGYVVRGTVVLAMYGPASYASWLGRIARVRMIVAALAPFVLALVLERYGAASALLVCAAAGLAATLCFLHVARRYR